MTELGRRLREAREARGLSLAEVEAATRVREKFIAALETGKFEDLLPPIYLRGQLRALASFLGVDAAELMALYEQEAPVEAAAPAPHILAEPLVRSRRIDLEVVAGIVLLAAVVGVLVWVFQSYIQPLATVVPATPTTAVVVAAAPPTDTPPPTDTVTQTPERPGMTPVPTQTARITASPTQAAGAIMVTANISESTWLRVVVDGEQAFEGTLKAGEKRAWGAKQALSLRTGNAAGLTVMVNDRPQPSMGKRGEVVDRAWVLSPDGTIVGLTPPPVGTLTPTPGPTSTAGAPKP